MGVDISVETGKLEKNGFLNLDIDPSLDLFEEINKMKKEKNKLQNK